MNTLLNIARWCNGKKTYFVAAGMAIYGLLGLALGQMDQQQFMLVLFNAAGMAGLRHGVGKGEV
jgi:hypothetical protein